MMEFQKADKISEQEQTKISLINNNPINYVSYSLDFTENLNKFLEEDNNFQSGGLHNLGIQDIGNYYNTFLNIRNCKIHLIINILFFII